MVDDFPNTISDPMLKYKNELVNKIRQKKKKKSLILAAIKWQ